MQNRCLRFGFSSGFLLSVSEEPLVEVSFLTTLTQRPATGRFHKCRFNRHRIINHKNYKGHSQFTRDAVWSRAIAVNEVVEVSFLMKL